MPTQPKWRNYSGNLTAADRAALAKMRELYRNFQPERTKNPDGSPWRGFENLADADVLLQDG